jgi:hypothetical protein
MATMPVKGASAAKGDTSSSKRIARSKVFAIEGFMGLIWNLPPYPKN